MKPIDFTVKEEGGEVMTKHINYILRNQKGYIMITHRC